MSINSASEDSTWKLETAPNDGRPHHHPPPAFFNDPAGPNGRGMQRDVGCDESPHQTLSCLIIRSQKYPSATQLKDHIFIPVSRKINIFLTTMWAFWLSSSGSEFRRENRKDGAVVLTSPRLSRHLAPFLSCFILTPHFFAFTVIDPIVSFVLGVLPSFSQYFFSGLFCVAPIYYYFRGVEDLSFVLFSLI